MKLSFILYMSRMENIFNITEDEFQYISDSYEKVYIYKITVDLNNFINTNNITIDSTPESIKSLYIKMYIEFIKLLQTISRLPHENIDDNINVLLQNKIDPKYYDNIKWFSNSSYIDRDYENCIHVLYYFSDIVTVDYWEKEFTETLKYLKHILKNEIEIHLYNDGYNKAYNKILINQIPFTDI